MSRAISYFLQDICGLPITTYFSAVKLRWLLDNCPKVAQAAAEGRCLFGTVDSWLIWVSMARTHFHTQSHDQGGHSSGKSLGYFIFLQDQGKVRVFCKMIREILNTKKSWKSQGIS